MSDHIKDGGPAFPPMHDPRTHESGMSLRDWFAGRAMQAMSSDMGDIQQIASQNGVHPTTLLARLSYNVADAMLAAREGGAS